MAIPRFTENTQQARGYTGERVRAADFGAAGEMIGGAIKRAGQAAGEFAERQDRINTIYDEAAAKRADTESIAKISEIKQRYKKLQGFEAVGAKGKAEEEIRKVGQEMRGALGTPRAQQMFGDVFDRRVAADLADIDDYETSQVFAAEKQVSVSRAEQYTELMTDSFDKPELFEEYKQTVGAELRTIYRGAGEDVIQQKTQQVVSGVHKRVLNNLLQNPENVAQAEAYYRRIAPELLADDEGGVLNMLQPLLDENEVYTAFGELVSGGTSKVSTPDTSSATPVAGATSRQATPGEAPPAVPSAPTKRESATSPRDPTRGKGRVTNTAAQHRDRGSDSALDIAAPSGTPIYPPMSGKVVGNFWHDRGGWTVMVEHPNGYATGYAHMRAQSPLQVGASVTANTVLGGVGSTGKSSGPHVHYTVRKSKGGGKVDPASVKWAEGTVDPEGVDWKENLQLFTPERNDKADLYRRAHEVASTRNLSPRQYQQLLQLVDNQVSREDNLFARERDTAEETVWSTIAAKGGKITSLSDIPAAQFAKMGPAAKMQVQNLIEQNNRPVPTPANGSSFQTLSVMSNDPAQQEAFKGINIWAVTGITEGERTTLLNRQASLRPDPNAPNKTTGGNYIGSMFSAMDRYGSQAGYKTGKDATPEDGRRREKLRSIVEPAIQDIEAREKRPATQQEIDAIVRRNVIATDVVTPGRIFGENRQAMPRYLVDEVEGPKKLETNIPTREYNRIKSARERLGLPVDGASILRVYREELGSR